MHGTINKKNFNIIFPENSRKIFTSVSLIRYIYFLIFRRCQRVDLGSVNGSMIYE